MFQKQPKIIYLDVQELKPLEIFWLASSLVDNETCVCYLLFIYVDIVSMVITIMVMMIVLQGTTIGHAYQFGLKLISARNSINIWDCCYCQWVSSHSC